jgi:hypothetical protein
LLPIPKARPLFIDCRFNSPVQHAGWALRIADLAF